MKPALFAALIIIAVIVAAFYWVRAKRLRGAPPAQPSSAVDNPISNPPLMEMRKKLLRGTASEFHIEATPTGAWGCLMEMGTPSACATLVSLADGTTSLYISTGGGYIGGGGHATVAAATKRFVEMAGLQAETMAKTTDFPMPQAGRIRFYVLTADGVVTSEADENDLREGKHPLSPLFFAGHEVITQFRLVTEKQQH